jgi:DNA-binding HxlR family transcriptional regulator
MKPARSLRSPERVPRRRPAPALLRETDRLLHERVRLGIVSLLAANGALAFSELKALLETTDGNLSVHARRLEEAGYVACAKSFAGRTPRTEYRLTAAGRRAFEKHLDHLEALVAGARRGGTG